MNLEPELSAYKVAAAVSAKSWAAQTARIAEIVSRHGVPIRAKSGYVYLPDGGQVVARSNAVDHPDADECERINFQARADWEATVAAVDALAEKIAAHLPVELGNGDLAIGERIDQRLWERLKHADG